jgi:hypothetical protein
MSLASTSTIETPDNHSGLAFAIAAPSKQPLTVNPVAHASASMQIAATTNTKGGEAISGPPRRGSIVGDRVHQLFVNEALQASS